MVCIRGYLFPWGAQKVWGGGVANCTVVQWRIHANLAGILGLQVVQHDLLSGALGFKYKVKHNVFYIFSFLDNVAIWPSYVSAWALLWTKLAPFGTSFSSTPPFFLSGRGGCVTILRWCINAYIGQQHEPKMTQHGSYIRAQGFKNKEKRNVF